jgi:hypothetical protein
MRQVSIKAGDMLQQRQSCSRNDSILGRLKSENFRHKKTCCIKQVNLMVGTRGFEPPTPSPPAKCATKLRYVPTLGLILLL